ncbi:glycoside hydrolase family 30 protein [Coniophora puteana RWD-64-598 SS2]|uniref:Glycoside hydrolase family 30 protein n=1 Tax=Coniophora puteana (strain RWD-64-598) TaxID=741705 RepID=A0A5M3MCM4_CONPW|nr:glycoside hydrolase family 30 protein [Coniophora puteana RWD-64-598 SS2]EIW76813.1 glycoside hydrolase family 30 protein [Coniophora puteana RWD-64-598 SS2]
MRRSFVVAAFALVHGAAAQQIQDVWQTTWDKASLLASTPPASAIAFGTPGTAAAADIQIDDTQVYQTIQGFGATLTDSSAKLLDGLKTANSDEYWKLMDYMFNITDGANSASLSYVRVPLGASDFSTSVYSFDDTAGDTGLTSFNIDASPSYLFSTLTDILSVNSAVRFHLVPWSPPAWMKTPANADGGSLNDADVNSYAQYIVDALTGFQGKNIPVFAVGIQNEPENSDTTYPSTSMPVATEAAVGEALRPLMNSAGFTDVKLIGYEHNWDHASAYPVQLMQAAESSFDGVSFHCYEGTYEEQANFTSQYPDKEVYFTECTGTLGSDWWTDIKWNLDNIMIGAIEYGASSGLMWNLALDGSGQPILPGSDSCTGGCRGVVTINSDGTWSANQELYSLGQAAKAIIPKDPNGPWGQRIGVTVAGSNSWALRVGAYKTGRASSSDPSRWALVVLNWDDSSSTTFNPVAVDATIEFQGKQAAYTFPVGVTTLWWFA